MIPCDVISLNLSRIYVTNHFCPVHRVPCFPYSTARSRRWGQLESWRSWNNENTGRNGTQIRVTVEELWPIEVEEKSKEKKEEPLSVENWRQAPKPEKFPKPHFEPVWGTNRFGVHPNRFGGSDARIPSFSWLAQRVPNAYNSFKNVFRRICSAKNRSFS